MSEIFQISDIIRFSCRMDKVSFILMSDYLFELPCLIIDLLVKEENAQPRTAFIYLKELKQDGLLTAFKVGKNAYFVNQWLMDLLVRRS